MASEYVQLTIIPIKLRDAHSFVREHHRPHAHPQWTDEAPRYWCRGVEDVRVVLDSTGC